MRLALPSSVAKLIPAKPSSIIAQVAGSGTAVARTTSQLGARDNHNRDRDDGDCQKYAGARAEVVEPSAHRSTSYTYGTLPEVPNGPTSLFGLSRPVGG
jgi:hypothetical protein